jgi:TIR domain-containing protein
MSLSRGSGFNAFLSHSHNDSEWVQQLAGRLEDECGFRVWLDRWRLVPGESWQQEMALGLDHADTCVVCVGSATPAGWFQQEIERALDIQSKDDKFRVIPLLLPDASPDSVSQFLGLRTWVDFRRGQDEEYAFHILECGIKGEPPGRWPPNQSESANNAALEVAERKLQELKRLEKYVREEVVIEIQRKILNQWIEK